MNRLFFMKVLIQYIGFRYIWSSVYITHDPVKSNCRKNSVIFNIYVFQWFSLTDKYNPVIRRLLFWEEFRGNVNYYCIFVLYESSSEIENCFLSKQFKKFFCLSLLRQSKAFDIQQEILICVYIKVWFPYTWSLAMWSRWKCGTWD